MKLMKKDVDLSFIGKIENIVKANGSTFACAGAGVALVLTICAAFKASPEVTKIKEKYDPKIEEIKSRASEEPKTKELLKDTRTERNLRYILAYKWVLLFGGSSLGLMILCKYIDGIAIAGLTTLVATNQEKLKLLAENAKQMIGEEKFKEIEDKSLEDLVLENLGAGEGPVAIQPKHDKGQLWLCTLHGVMFQMTRKDLLEAFEWAENQCKTCHGLSEDKWWSHIGYEPPTDSRNNFWGPKCPFKAHLGTRTFLGVAMESVEFEHLPQSAKNAGIPTVMPF